MSVEKRLETNPPPADRTFAALAIEKIKNLSLETDNSLVFGLNNNNLWPFVHIQRFGLILVAIPVIEGTFRTATTVNTPVHQLPLVQLPFITASVVFLEDFSQFVSSCGPNYTVSSLQALHPILSRILPFGKPLDTDFRNTTAPKYMEKGDSSLSNQKHPGFRPDIFKGKQKVEFTIVETITGHQYDHGDIPNKLGFHGSVFCKADLEGLPDLTVQLTPKGPHNLTPQITCHPNASLSVDNVSKITISPPPLGEFLLCRYAVNSGSKRMPLRGYYQMKEESPKEVKILLQMKLDKLYVNDFEYCRVILPFPNRGLIDSSKDAPSAGSVTITEDLKSLVWDIGTRFTGPNQEIVLQSTINFVEEDETNNNQQQNNNQTESDDFLVGPNSYVRIEFKMKNCGHFEILSKNVSIFPKGKEIIFINQNFAIAGEYYVWNSFGEARYSLEPTEIVKKEQP